MPDVMRRRRADLAWTQSDLAAVVGVDGRQIRRYESGDTQPSLAIARLIAKALGVSLDELAGDDTPRRVDLSGDWWTSWQTYKDGDEIITEEEASGRQSGEVLQLTAGTRGLSMEDGGYLWRAELRIWDNSTLMGWYAADEAAVRSKGTLFYNLHEHGLQLHGRWVGLSYDGPVMTGWATMARTEDDARRLMQRLLDTEELRNDD